MNRRAFVLTAASAARVMGANQRIRAGLIGCGGRGRYVAGTMSKVPGVEFTAFCDVHDDTASRARELLGAGGRTFNDFRKLLELNDLEAVLIATPDHWHAIATILACEAGKHVYVEKPLGHSIREGRAMVNAARRYKRTVQVGTQQRSATHFPEVARIIQSGDLGKVHLVRVWNFFNMFPNGIGREPDGPVPPGLDWDMYCGPAPLVPYNRKRFQVTYRWFWDYAGGTITDFGNHRFDTVHQVMGVNRPVPLKVAASGGRFALDDAGEMPDVLQVTYEYPSFVMNYETCTISAHGLGGRTAGMKYYNARGAEDRPHGMAFYGTKGALFADRIGFEIYPDRDGIERRTHNTTDATPLHTKNFIECLRDQKPSPADVEIGHWGTTIAHLGNIAYKTGVKLRWDPVKEDFIDAPKQASALLYRTPRQKWNLARS